MTKLFVIFALLITSNLALARSLPENERIYIESFEVALRILEKCPPAQCIPVGIGRSPTPILAAIKYLTGEAYQLPLTQFRNPIIETDSDFYDKPLNEAQRANLHQHFDRYLPSQAARKGRSIMVIDYSLTGQSLLAAQAHMQEYFTQKNLNISIHNFMMILYYEENIDLIKESARQVYGIDHLNPIRADRYRNLNKALARSRFDFYSQYGSYNPTLNDRVFKNDDGYAQLQSKIAHTYRRHEEVRANVFNTLGTKYMKDFLPLPKPSGFKGLCHQLLKLLN